MTPRRRLFLPTVLSVFAIGAPLAVDSLGCGSVPPDPPSDGVLPADSISIPSGDAMIPDPLEDAAADAALVDAGVDAPADATTPIDTAAPPDTPA